MQNFKFCTFLALIWSAKMYLVYDMVRLITLVAIVHIVTIEVNGERCRGDASCINSLAICPCDLLENICDINCCCDSDCDADDRKAFSSCRDIIILQHESRCVDKRVFFLHNVPYEVEETAGGLLCIYYNNYKQSTQYKDVEPIRTIEDYEAYEITFPKFANAKDAAKDNEFHPYRSGDPVLVLYSSNMALGHLPQPSTSASSQLCLDSNPAAYLVSRSTFCTRNVADLATQCTENPMLNAATYYDKFQIVQNSEVFTPLYGNVTHNLTEYGKLVLAWYKEWMLDRTVPPAAPVLPALSESPYLVNVTVNVSETKCADVNGIVGSCPLSAGRLPAPSLINDTAGGNQLTCQNVVTKVAYRLIWASDIGITSVQVAFTLGTIAAGGLPLTQTFQTQYVPFSANKSVGIPFSGNPGYIVNEPLRVGQLVTSGASVAILMSADRDNAMSMLSADVSGNCVSSGRRATVKFAINMRSGCFISLSVSKLAELCRLAHSAAFVALHGPNIATHVATFGNSDITVVGDWVEIIGVIKSPPPVSAVSYSEKPGTCHHVMSGLDIQFVYTSVGSVSNPQARIIGARYQYTYKDINIRCTGPFCRPSTQAMTQRFEIASSVTFIDMTRLATGVFAVHTPPYTGLPLDFFHPMFTRSDYEQRHRPAEPAL